jgi:hypothetical protein
LGSRAGKANARFGGWVLFTFGKRREEGMLKK